MIRTSTLWARISLKTKALMLVSLVMLGASGLVVAWTSSVMKEGFADKARQEQVVAMRVAAHVFRQKIPQAEIQTSPNGVERVRLAALPEFPNHDLVDEATRIAGGTVTVFTWDAALGDFRRVTTTVKKADGSRAVGTVLGVNNPVFKVVRAGEPYRGEATILGIDYYTEYVPILSGNAVIGVLYVGIRKDAYLALSNRMETNISLALVLATLAGLILVALAVSRGMRPLQDYADQIRLLAQGETELRISGHERQDELGELARAMTELRERIVERNALQEESNRRALHDEARTEALESASLDLSRAAETSIETVLELASGLRRASGQLHEAAQTSSGQLGEAGKAMTTATDNVRSAAAAAEELSAVIAEISRQVSKGGAVTAETVQAMQVTRDLFSKFDEASRKIGDVVKLITAIAEQTNLLALNATIEAARAGESGRGFAIVAQEVKQLANQTARATDDIRHQIQSMRSATGEAVQSLGHLNSCVTEMDGLTMTLAGAIEQQSAATEEIARAISAAAGLSAEANASLASIEHMVSENVSAGRDVDRSADVVLAEVRRLKGEIDVCVARLQAA